MAGSATITYEGTGIVQRIINIAWTSDAAGAVNGAAAVTKSVRGYIMKVVTIPDPTDAPTADYDVNFQDENDIDITGTLLDDRHTSTTQQVIPAITLTDGTNAAPTRIWVDGAIRLIVEAAGAAKKGVVKIYMNDSQ